MDLTIVKQQEDTVPQPVRLLQMMYEPSTIPICILNESFNVTWHNQAMERVCPDIVAPGRILSDTTFSIEWLSDYLKKNKNFCDFFQADSVFAPFGFVLGLMPTEEILYYLQARDTLDCGTWRNPLGMERAVNAFESSMRKGLNAIFQGLKKEKRPDVKKIRHGAENIYRTMLMTNDYTRLLGGLYSAEPVCVELQSFLCSLLECAGELIESKAVFEYGCFRNACETATQPVLLATILCHLISNAVRYGGAENHIFVQAAIQEKELQISITNQGTGIPMEILPHIYEPYKSYPKTGKDIFQGYGLGLTIAQVGAVFLGGSLNGFSQAERTMFRLLLPLRTCDTGRHANKLDNHLPGYADYQSFVKIILADCL